MPDEHAALYSMLQDISCSIGKLTAGQEATDKALRAHFEDEKEQNVKIDRLSGQIVDLSTFVTAHYEQRQRSWRVVKTLFSGAFWLFWSVFALVIGIVAQVWPEVLKGIWAR